MGSSSTHQHITMAKKKGFMTPERKKKLRTLLRKKAAEELKKEQERKAAERQRVISERCGTKKDIENASEDELKKIVKEYFDKWYNLEGVQVREQVRQAPRKGRQVCVRKPAQSKGQVERGPILFHPLYYIRISYSVSNCTIILLLQLYLHLAFAGLQWKLYTSKLSLALKNVTINHHLQNAK